MSPLSLRIKEFSATCKAIEPDDEKCVVLHKLLDAWADAALKLETALHDARQQAAARKVEADDLRTLKSAIARQLDAVAADSKTWPAWKKREVDMPEYGTTGEESRGGEV